MELQLAQTRTNDLTFLLGTPIKESSAGSAIKAVGQQFALLRRLRRFTAEEVARKIDVPLSNIEGIERGHTAKGSTLATYFRYADELSVSLQAVFMLAVGKAVDGDYSSTGAQYQKIQQTLEEGLDTMLLEAVSQAIQHLQTEKVPITQEAIGKLVQMTPQGLKHYPRVRKVLEQLAEHNRIHQRRETELLVEQRMQQVRTAANQLRAVGEPVTQRAISRVAQIPWSSLRTHSAIRALLREVCQT